MLVLHDLKLIHTDLKPENILLVRNDSRVIHVPVPGKVMTCPLSGGPPYLWRHLAQCPSQTQANPGFDRHSAD